MKYLFQTILLWPLAPLFLFCGDVAFSDERTLADQVAGKLRESRVVGGAPAHKLSDRTAVRCNTQGIGRASHRRAWHVACTEVVVPPTHVLDLIRKLVHFDPGDFRTIGHVRSSSEPSTVALQLARPFAYLVADPFQDGDFAWEGEPQQR